MALRPILPAAVRYPVNGKPPVVHWLPVRRFSADEQSCPYCRRRIVPLVPPFYSKPVKEFPYRILLCLNPSRATGRKPIVHLNQYATMKRALCFILFLCSIGTLVHAQCNCVPVSSVSVSSVTTNTATVTWTPAFGQTRSCIFVVSVQNLSAGTPAVQTQVSGSPTYNMTGLIPGDNYRVSVYINNTTQGCNGAPVSAIFTTTGSYCSASSATSGNFITMQYLWLDENTSNKIWPNGVMTNVSPGPPYVSMPNILTLQKNQTVINAMGIYFQAHSNTIPPFTLYENLWIDFDRNGVFDTYEHVSSGSFVYASSSPPSSTGGGVDISGPTTFLPYMAIPNLTASGLKARFILSVNQDTGPCSSFGEGQVVDFRVSLVP